MVVIIDDFSLLCLMFRMFVFGILVNVVFIVINIFFSYCLELFYVFVIVV